MRASTAIWLLLLPACGTDDGPGFAAGDDTGGSTSTDDTGEALPWGELETAASWVSEDRGVATGLAFGDMDGDGDPDLVVAYGNDITPGPVAVYLNVDGELPLEPDFTTAATHYFGHLALGDIDGDGVLDVAVSRFLGDGKWEEPGGVQVYRGLGNGQLEEGPHWEASGFFTFSCALGDADNDGDLDLAVAVGEGYKHDPDLSRVYLNDGTGDLGLEPAWTTESPRHSMDVIWADLDRDGLLDLAFANEDFPHTVYLNDGGSFPDAPDWEAPDDLVYEGNTLDWGDVDGDGNLDLLISDNEQKGGDGVVRVYLGPDLQISWTSGDAATYQSAVSLEDVDGDGFPEVVAGAWWGAVRIYDNDGGTVESTPSWTSDMDEIVVEAFGWADLDGSHWTEATVSGTGLVEIPGRGRVLSVEGGVAGFGYVSGPGEVKATYLVPMARDLAVSDWTKQSGNRVYRRD